MKQLDEDGVERIDGRPISDYQGKVINAFPVETSDAIGFSNGDIITLILTVRVETPKFSEIKKSGVMRRQDQFRVMEQLVMDPDLAKQMYDNLDMSVFGVNEGVVVTYNADTEQKEIVISGFDPEEGKL